MANVCTNYMHMKGDPRRMDRLQKRLESQDKRLLKLFPWFEKDLSYGMYSLFRQNEATVIVYFTSKWRAPVDEIERLSKAFGLEITCRYEEPGNRVYGRVCYDHGEMTEDRSYDEESWLEEENEDFRECKREIQEGSYENFIRDYKEGIDWEDIGGSPQWSILEKYIVERIKDEDLPLFINTPWMSSEAQRMYSARFEQVQIGGIT